MAISVQMPALGESVTEGTVTRWLKQEGDTVEVDEPLLEVSTDKVDTEIPSPAAGVLTKIVAQEDDTVEVGGELGRDRRGRRRAAAATAAGRRGPPPRRSRPSAEPRSQKPAAGTRRAAGAGRRSRRNRHPSPSREAGRQVVRRRGDLGDDARAGRVGHRGHRDALAEEGRRQCRGRRAAGRGVHRQGRHRDPVAGGGHAAVASPPRRTTPSPSAASWPRSATPAPRRPKSRSPSRNPSRNQRPKPEPEPEPEAKRPSRSPKPEPEAGAEARSRARTGAAGRRPSRPATALRTSPRWCESWPPRTTSTWRR